MSTVVMGIRDTRGGTHIQIVRAGEPLSAAVRRFTHNVIAAGRSPVVVLTCIPGGKTQ